MRRITAIALGLGLGLALLSVETRALSDKDIPEPLRPWKAWVLHGHEEINCPAIIDTPPAASTRLSTRSPSDIEPSSWSRNVRLSPAAMEKSAKVRMQA